MANRDLNSTPQVTNVTPLDPNTGTPVNLAADIGDQVANMSAQSKALAATAQTSAAFRALDTQFRTQNADNPNDPQALSDYRDARQQIIQQIGSTVPNIAQRDYFSKTIELGQASDTSNQLWTTRQLVHNATNNLATGTQNYYQQANDAGRDFAQNGGDIGQALQYAQAAQTLHQFADPVIGADRAGAYLKDFNANYTKSFVAGVAENDPQKAAALLADPAISQHFTTQDIGDMTQLIAKTQKQQALAQSLQTTKNDGQLVDILNDPNTGYFQKRVTIDQLNMQGSVTPEAATKAMRVLNSQNDLDSQTDTPQMASVINKVYDLNAQAATKPDDYLAGVRDIQQQVLELQANNQLTQKDAGKLNKEINDLTSAKLASATNTAGNEFYDANQAFNVLPPEYRGQATRALFYASHGQQMTAEQLKAQAGQVIDQINAQRRQQALTTVSRIGSDDALLQSAGYTRQDVQDTAAKYGTTPDAVIQQLRSHYAAKRGQQPVKGVSSGPSGGDEEPDSAGIRINSPAPPSMEPENDDSEER